MMRSCKETARLLSESMETRLSLGRRLSLRFHLMMCRLCRRHAKQQRALDRTLRMLSDLPEEELPGNLSPEARGRIEAALRGR